mmetsp:Transcript_3676/g.9344  ORF Transcript_3676/g.9344 Transcript_3676/m.9344 type:complete len:517 (+) Transcript_3676:267-1817(+)
MLVRVPLDLVQALMANNERFLLQRAALAEATRFLSQRRLKRAMDYHSPSLPVLRSEPGDLVLVMRKADKEWTGPYRLLTVDLERKTAAIMINGESTPLALHCIRPLLSPTAAVNFVLRRSSRTTCGKTPSRFENHDRATPQTPASSAAPTRSIPSASLHHHLPRTIPASSSLLQKGPPALTPAATSSQYPTIAERDISILVAELLDEPPDAIHLFESIAPADTRSHDPRFIRAKKQELLELLRRGAFDVVLAKDVEPTATRLGCRYPLTIKDIATDRERFKVRLIIQGHRDKAKRFLVPCSSSFQYMNIRLLLIIACSKRLSIRTRDVDQAYLQSTFPYLRDVFIKQTTDMSSLLDEDPGEPFFLKMNLPVSGNSDAGDYWHVTNAHYHRETLGMQPSDFDPSFYRIDGDEQGLIATRMDDSLITSNTDFLKKEDEKSSMFQNKGKSRATSPSPEYASRAIKSTSTSTSQTTSKNLSTYPRSDQISSKNSEVDSVKCYSSTAPSRSYPSSRRHSHK